MSATSTLPAAGSQRPRFALVAARTAKPFRPAQAEQILPAGLLAAESSFEFRQCPRIVLHQLFHEPPHYLLWLPESSGYPITIIFGNSGIVNAHDAVLTLIVPNNLTLDVSCPLPIPNDIGLPWNP